MTVWLLLLLCVLTRLPEHDATADLEDNNVPTDEEVIRALLIAKDKGQPEYETSLGLPTDEQSYNELKTLYSLIPSGTHHFVSSSFPEVDSRGFHEAVFENFHDYYPSWFRHKRDPLGINSRGFHDDVFSQDFGSFHPVKRSNRHEKLKAVGYLISPPNKRRKRDVEEEILEDRVEEREGKNERGKRAPEMGSAGFHGDTFSGGFGDFWTMKRRGPVDKFNLNDSEKQDLLQYLNEHKRRLGMGASGFHGDTFTNGFGDFSTMKRGNKIRFDKNELHDSLGLEKRKPEMQSSGFHGDTFSNGFGDFWTMKKRKPEMDSSGFHGDTFNSGFGDFWPMKKRKPEMDSSGFHGDTFNSGFGDFWPMKKRKPEMQSSGFHGDTFSNGFGDFWTMKKRKPEMDSSGFHGDTFNSGFGDFWPMRKRKPEMDSSGFHGDTFKSGFGDFWTMKKRKPEMDSSGFHGDTFNAGFGDFYTMKKRDVDATSSASPSSPPPPEVDGVSTGGCDDCSVSNSQDDNNNNSSP